MQSKVVGHVWFLVPLFLTSPPHSFLGLFGDVVIEAAVVAAEELEVVVVVAEMVGADEDEVCGWKNGCCPLLLSDEELLVTWKGASRIGGIEMGAMFVGCVDDWRKKQSTAEAIILLRCLDRKSSITLPQRPLILHLLCCAIPLSTMSLLIERRIS
jgi:hypothetical protein